MTTGTKLPSIADNRRTLDYSSVDRDAESTAKRNTEDRRTKDESNKNANVRRRQIAVKALNSHDMRSIDAYSDARERHGSAM